MQRTLLRSLVYALLPVVFSTLLRLETLMKRNPSLRLLARLSTRLLLTMFIIKTAQLAESPVWLAKSTHSLSNFSDEIEKAPLFGVGLFCYACFRCTECSRRTRQTAPTRMPMIRPIQ